MYFLLLLQQLISASTHLVAKSVTQIIHPAQVVLWRGIFTCIAFGLWLWIRRSKQRRIDPEDYISFLVLGLINIPINQMLFVWGVKYTTAPNAALAYALTPAFVLVIGRLFLKEKLDKWMTSGISIAFVGAALVLLDRGARVTPEHTLGNIMVLCASASWAVYTILGKPLVIKYGAIYTTAISFLIGLTFFIPVYSMIVPTVGIENPAVPDAPAVWWSQVLYLGVITSGVGYGLWYLALTKLDSGKVAVFNNLQPILTTILALVLFGTQPTPLFIVGGLIAIVGVVITQLKGILK